MSDAFWIVKQQIEEKDKEIERLRRLLRQCQPFVDRLQPPKLDLSVEIAEELKRNNHGQRD